MKFRKLMSLLLTMAMAAGVCSLPAMAEETGCLNILSDTVYTFDGDDVTAYGSVEGIGDDYAGNVIEIVPEEDGSENKVLKLTQGNAGAAVKIRPWADASGNGYSDLHFAFDIKRSGTDTEPFYLDGWSGEVFLHILRMQGGAIYLNSTAVYAYELDTWYHIDLKLNLANGDTTLDGSGDYHYAKLSVTKRGESEPTVIDLPYGLHHRPSGNERNLFKRVYLGWFAKNADGGSVMIDNYMQNDITENPVAVSMDSHDDNFDTLPPVDAGGNGKWNQNNVASRTGWTFTNAKDSTTASIEDGKLKLYTENNAFPEFAKIPFWSTPDVRHRISLKMNGHGEGQTQRSVRIKFSGDNTNLLTGSSSSSANYYEKDLIDIIAFKNGRLNLYGQSGINLVSDPDFMYPIEIVYDAAAKICAVTITDQFGVQHEADISAKIQEKMNTLRNDGDENGKWYNLGAFAIRFPSGAGGNGICYIDDFNWDVLDTADAEGSASIASGSDGAASLDETVVIDYGRPVSFEKSCTGENQAEVTVTSNGQAVNVPYTLSARDGKLHVNLKGLKPQTSYTVTVSDAKLMETDVATEDVSVTFTTWGTSIGVSNIQLFDGDTNVSADIISGYADGTDVTLAAKQYTGGIQGEIKTGYASVMRGFPETVSLHTPFTGTADSTEVFVWSDFVNMIPYCEKTVLGTSLSSTAVPTLSGDGIIDNISVDDGADTLTIAGTLPQNAEKWVTVEILKPGFYWTAADAVAAGYSAENSLEAYEEGTDDIRSYLVYFGQVDNKAGQPYSIVVNNYVQSDYSNLECRMRLGDGSYYYYSYPVLESLNNAADGATIKTIVEGFAYLKNETAAERALLAPDEESHFYTNILNYRNSLTGGKFRELFDVIDASDDIVRITKLKLAENETDLNEVLDLCSDYGISDYNSYDLYKGINAFKLSEGACLNATQKAALISNLLGKKNTYASVEAFTADFNAQAVLYAASGADSKNLVLHLLKNADVLNGKLGTFATCGNTKQLSVCDTINKKSVFATIDALGSEVTTLSAAPDSGQQGGELEPEGGTGSAGSVSGSGGSGGGGGGNNKDKETDKEKEDETTAEKKEENEKTFIDLAEVEWAQEAIYALREKGIVSGRSEEIFDPTSTVTREEFAKMLVLAIGCYDETATTEFADVSADAWSYSYIASAAKNGLINGIGNGKFGIGGIISRQDMALLIARAAGFTDDDSESGFADDALISDYARAAVGYVRTQGLMNGVGDNKFAPMMNVSRAQAAKVIYELIQRG